MNIRFSQPAQGPSFFQSIPATVERIGGRIGPRTRLIGGIVGAVLALALVWYLVGVFSAPAPRVAPPIAVTVGVAERRDVRVVEHTIGTILAQSTVQLTAQVTGQLLSANFTEGQIVHQGDLLFRIDPRPYQATLNSAVATLTSTKAKAERYAKLLAEKAVAPQDADDAKAAYLQAAAAVDTARLNLNYTKIYSPITGKTGPILIQPGNLITANSGLALVTITQIQPVKISLFLPQNDLPQIQSQMSAGKLQAVIPMPGAPGDNETAPVDFVGNAVSAQTGTIELRATFANLDMRLVPGQMLDVGITTKDLPHVIVVPRNAINLGTDKSYVYVVSAQAKAEAQTVSVLYDDGTDVAVQGNIKPGDRVVTEGGLRIVEGSSVAINRHPGVPITQAPIGAQ
jgi:multidrug efflux system membrane fusion protein